MWFIETRWHRDYAGEDEKYTLVLANPPFVGSLDYENTAKDLLQIVRTKKTELLFLALFLRNSGGTEQVWFYEVEADGWSLDDKRQPLLPEEKLGAVPRFRHGSTEPLELVDEEHAKNNLPDVLARWVQREGNERERSRTAQSFCVPKAEIAENGYDLSLNRYKEVVHEEVDHVPPQQILTTLEQLETQIQKGMQELREMLG